VIVSINGARALPKVKFKGQTEEAVRNKERREEERRVGRGDPGGLAFAF
jgi:hypothetical protein